LSLVAVGPACARGVTGGRADGAGAAHHHEADAANRPAPLPPASPTLPTGLPGMPPLLDPRNVAAAAGPGMLSAAAAAAKPLVYVPHTRSGEVWVIDQASFQVVGRYPAGVEVQHVVPAYDMTALYATDDLADHLLEFDPRSGLPTRRIPVVDPYNLYFTPDGRYAVSVAEARRMLVWYDPHSWQERGRTPTPDCAGIDHADFSADGRTAVFTCEFAGRVAVVDVAGHQVLRMIDMPRRHTHMGPQDIKLSPDGTRYYIADSDAGGLWVLDGAATAVVGFLPTGHGAHGLYLDRTARRLFVTNRHEGSVSVLDPADGHELAKWWIPGGGSPDMGNVSADGSQLWLSGRHDDTVYVLATTDGHLLHRIPVGHGPHGLCVWPQPGRYSLGHTGITR
jgi:DNA-binding beta-propeller fold protein YncE